MELTLDEAKSFWHCAETEAPRPMSDSMLESFQGKHGIALPDSFVMLYRCQNGGYSPIHGGAFWSIGADSCPVTSLDVLCGGYHDDEVVARWKSEFLDLSRVVVFFGDGHFYFAIFFDSSNNEEAFVWYLDEDETRCTGQSFAEWLRSHARL